MRRFLPLVSVFVFLVTASPSAGALSSPMELVVDQPAATLLLPYFEVDLSDRAGSTTVFSVNNASATAVLAHVTLWSDLSVPVLAFNLYLTGYDVQYVDLRSVLAGRLPQTASAGQDPNDSHSPKGPFSQDINFASCTGQLPPPPLPAAYVSHLRRSLTGQPSALFAGLCAGRDRGDRKARGYVTVDTVNNCTLRVAGDPGYFASGGTGDATNQNVLWGEFFYLNPGNARRRAAFSQAGALVAIRASATDPETSVPGEYTFYGRYVNWTAADNRQPLATTFGARYLDGRRFGTSTALVAWRDPKVDQSPVVCGTIPAWFPLGQEGLVIFDEAEDVFLPPVIPVFPPPPAPTLLPFPAATQMVRVGSPDLPIPFRAGWVYLNLNTTVPVAGANPPEDPAAAQAWVYVVQDPRGRFNSGYPAVQLDSAANASHLTP